MYFPFYPILILLIYLCQNSLNYITTIHLEKQHSEHPQTQTVQSEDHAGLWVCDVPREI